MPTLGPITTKLESELSSRLRNHSLVVWLDKDGHYTDYVNQLAERRSQGNFFAPVVAFRGSYLETMLALEPYGNQVKPDILLIHMPGHTEETIRETPLLELYRAGYRYRKALDTLVREAAAGKVGPSEVDSYLNREPVSLGGAEQWLAAAIAQPDDTSGPTLIDFDDLTYILDELLAPKPSFKQKFETPAALPLLADYLYRYTGIDTDFLSFYLNDAKGDEQSALAQPPHRRIAYSFTELSEAFCAWLMCVEYAHDLMREPKMLALKRLKGLSQPLLAECGRLIQHLRDRHPDSYITIADATENRLSEEFAVLRPEDLGKIDTFRLEETTVFTAGAIASLHQHRWQQALTWAEIRLDARQKGRSFWLQRSPERRLEWTLIQSMAQLGTTIEQVGTPISSAQTLRAALDAYTQTGYKVDLAHRQMEQTRSQLLESTLPHFNELQTCADDLRQRYRDWANLWASAFASLCEADSFLPEATLQQRMIYDQVVHPLVKSAAKGEAKAAYFLVDALRYEMAVALSEALEADATPSTTVRLSARYAELPTLTSVGMNVLAPVQKGGRLTLATTTGFDGFRAGEYSVRSFENRVRAMGDRSATNAKNQPKLVTLLEVCEKPTKSLKASLQKTNFAVVRSGEIDKAGESDIGITTFERWLQQLKAAHNRLKSLGFNEFVFTADHGFLLQDDTAVEGISWGTAPKRRHVLLNHARKEPSIVSVSLGALGYDGQSGHLHFSTTTNPFARGKAIATFIHGGNSLQERVIPVLTVSHRHNNLLNLVQYNIEAEALAAIAGYSRLRVQVKPAPTAQGVLSFTGAKTINLSLRVPDRREIDITIAEAPGAALKNQQVQVTVEQDWAEVLFNLVSLQDERVKVEVYQSDGAEDVTSALVDAYFDVAGTKMAADDSQRAIASETASEPTTDWQTSLEDDSIRRAFVHIQRHNAITESELITLLGSPRKVRRFAADFENYLQKVPFLVRVESTPSGKRYVKVRENDDH